MTATDSSYIYSQEWEHERTRLEGLSAQFDATTVRHLTAAGVTAGWRCLEVGAGAGSIARWLADTVGPGGRVVATDLDTRFLVDLPAPPVEVLRHDIAAEPLPDGGWDLIHARAVFEHVPDRRAAIARLVPALRPGGVLVLEDVVFGEPVAGMFDRGTHPREHGPNYARAVLAVAAGFGAIGADPAFGLELPDALTAAGLSDVDAEMTVRMVRGATPQAAFYELSLRGLGAKLVAAGLISAEDVDAALAFVTDPGSQFFSLGLVTAWGRRP